jgi:hypothetical protein
VCTHFAGGGAAVAAWPLAARAQQGDRVRRIGVLYPAEESDPLVKTSHLRGLASVVVMPEVFTTAQARAVVAYSRL